MPKTFAESIADTVNEVPDAPLLPLCHVAELGTIKKYIANSSISSEEVCDVFNERLNYFFYGRAAYRLKESADLETVLANPAAIIIHPRAVSKIFAVYPFDSGAFPRYKKYLSSHLQMSHFEMPRDVRFCDRVVKAFWHDHQAYVTARTNKFRADHQDSECDAIEAYSTLARRAKPEEVDERRSTIEISAPNSILLEPKDILGLVLPFQTGGYGLFAELEKNGTVVESYKYHFEKMSEAMSVVIHLALNIIFEVKEWK